MKQKADAVQNFAKPGSPAIDIHLVDPDGLDQVGALYGAAAGDWATAHAFTGRAGQVLTVPSEGGQISMVLLGKGTDAAHSRDRFLLGGARKAFPPGTYRLASPLGAREAREFALGWLLAGYTFDRYASQDVPAAELIAPEGVDTAETQAIAAGECLTRDLINTPASDMGPSALETAMRDLAEQHDATFEVIRGDDLLQQNFPMIHAVGRASADDPRLLDMRWGKSGPTLTLVGKGVCFDTGGLNIKPGASMGLMKKDMGGAAAVLGLAHMIMALKMPLRLRVLVPAVENAIDGSAMRPQDILTSRKGLTVEINNTDAEGRLVLADALALATEEVPDLLISMATLTGAARVAVGPDLAPFFTDDDIVADALAVAGADVRDPVWRMPFWDPYEKMIEPGIADLDNAPKGGFGGAITAALFLRRFATPARYLHFDIYGWQPAAAPARPKGGVGQGARAILDALPKVLGL